MGDTGALKITDLRLQDLKNKWSRSAGAALTPLTSLSWLQWKKRWFRAAMRGSVSVV